MNKKQEGGICPTCGQLMKRIKSHTHSTRLPDSDVDEEITVPKFKISEIWHCLNCSDEWQIDIMKNIWRKKKL